jgi:4-methyl-5(b-hydroxyethyl)-thiazole monophosphate biosynthesis
LSKRVLVPLAKGFEEIEAISIIDILRRSGVDVIVAGVNSQEVEGANSIVVKADRLIEGLSADEFDMIVLPGGFGGTEVLAQDEKVQTLIKELNSQNKRIGAICAAPFALNSAGVLRHNYTCYPSVEEKIRVGGYTDKQKVVTDGNIMTSRGPATAICFGLEIVKELVDTQTYEALKAGLLAEFC